jgi:hypothetical protein
MMSGLIRNARFFVVGLLASVMLLAGAATVRADDWCARHFRHEQRELGKAIAHHGFDSRQANH